MSDDYLWDRTGEPDPEVQRLERLLSQFRSDQPMPEMPTNPSASHRTRFWSLWRPLVAIAAMVVLVAGLWGLFQHFKPGWDVASLQGSPKIGSSRMGEEGRLAVGQWLETDGASRAILSIGKIGQVEIEPNTRVRLVKARASEHRIALARGTMHATIWAPPRLFFVDTPSATAVDLGCAYTLTVDDSGSGLLYVTHGWVAFDFHGHESFAPEGALCATRPGVGPGTPYFEDSSPAFQHALTRFDFGALGSPDRVSALATVLTEARPRDGLTLWHLISRVDARERGSVYDRMAELLPPPPGVTRDGILRLDQHMLDLWWDRLGFGDTQWWRLWEGKWPGEGK
ncbi:MAG: FecR domain-containing protein [Acidobacteriia bacterium]|nr:FecR domain-containing protein [Terriglobia bacterium]